MKRARPVATAILIIAPLLAGCDAAASDPSGQGPPAAVEPPAPVDAGSSAGAPEPAAAADEPAAAAEPLEGPLGAVQALPAIDRAPIPGSKAAQAQEAFDAAARLASNAKQRDEAITQFTEVLALDAGHGEARYELAGAFAAAKELDAALAVLEQFRDAGCPDCLYRVFASRADKRFKELHSDERYAALLEDVGRRVPSFEQANTVLRLWLQDPSAVDPPAIFEARASVAVAVGCRKCKDKSRLKPEPEALEGGRAVARWYNKRYASSGGAGHVEVREEPACKLPKKKAKKKQQQAQACCEFLGKREPLEPDRLYLERVCFEAVDEGPLWVASMQFVTRE
ncbi:MAG: tetratricopeptide repeat protein [Myxococcales bacterium]|nr:tetratricopeptide repeat protein [Myxococcales bacterium]